MTIHTFYRLCVWLPLAVPAAVAGITHVLGFMVDTGPLRKVVQVLLMSLLYGGVPYLLLALWATWWIGGRGEPEIKRLMFRAPLLMVLVFMIVSTAAGCAVGRSDVFLAVGVLGAIVIVPLGYAYVALVMLMREELGPQAI